jgi:cell division protein FtsW
VARKLKSDRVLFVVTVLLVCASVVMVYSASTQVALEKFKDPYYFLIRQGLWAVLGMAVLWFAMRIDYRTYRNEPLIWAGLAAVAIALVVALFSGDVKGGHRWVGFSPLKFQPSEFAKLACVFFTALTLERRMHRINDLSYSLAPIGIVGVVLAALIFFEPDYGTALSLLVIIGVMVFAAGLSYRYLITAALIAAPALLALSVMASYRRDRLMAFLDPWADPQHRGFQIIQSFIAIGTGGIFGRGLFDSIQKMLYLPEPHTDFVFSVIGEELGLIGATTVVACYCVIAWRGLSIASRAEDQFGSQVALGITTMIVVQAFVNLSVVLGLLPTKGIPLPLLSSGGSSLLVSLLGVGVLLNISQHASADA